jgi:hypothetical protein
MATRFVWHPLLGGKKKPCSLLPPLQHTS